MSNEVPHVYPAKTLIETTTFPKEMNKATAVDLVCRALKNKKVRYVTALFSMCSTFRIMIGTFVPNGESAEVLAPRRLFSYGPKIGKIAAIMLGLDGYVYVVLESHGAWPLPKEGVKILTIEDILTHFVDGHTLQSTMGASILIKMLGQTYDIDAFDDIETEEFNQAREFRDVDGKHEIVHFGHIPLMNLTRYSAAIETALRAQQ